MSTTEAVVAPKPFHESIVILIERGNTREQLRTIGALLLITEVPENHDAIAKAFDIAVSRYPVEITLMGRLAVEAVTTLLMEQKEDAKRKNFEG